MASHNRRVILNVGGTRHEVNWKTIGRFPTSRLAKLRHCKTHQELIGLCDDYNVNKNEYFFDRNPTTFGAILDAYRTGKLHLVRDTCVLSFTEDLRYWGIDELSLEPCCQQFYFERKEQVLEQLRMESKLWEETRSSQVTNEKNRATLVQFIWNSLENPSSSIPARIFSCLSVIFTVASTIVLILSTVRELNCYAKIMGQIEMSSITWFTLEYTLRLFTAPNKWKFFKNFLNIIDLLVIVPYFVWYFILEPNSNLERLRDAHQVIQILRIIRVLRILKLAKHSTGLRCLGFTLMTSYKELGLLLLFLSIGILIFSTFAYFAEKNQNGQSFGSIPDTFWWACITMTTVGYGDITPVTFLGKLLGAGCCICGVLVVALPIPIIVNNFTDFYTHQLKQKQILKRKSKLNEVLSSPSNHIGEDCTNMLNSKSSISPKMAQLASDSVKHN